MSPVTLIGYGAMSALSFYAVGATVGLLSRAISLAGNR